MSSEQRIGASQLAASLTRQSTLSTNEAETFVQAFFDVIRSSLVKDKIVKVRGLGIFKLVDVEARESVKVGTGERFTIEGHSKVTFTPDAVLRDAVNRPFADFETVVINDGVDIAALEAVDDADGIADEAAADVDDIPTAPLADDAEDNGDAATADTADDALIDIASSSPEATDAATADTADDALIDIASSSPDAADAAAPDAPDAADAADAANAESAGMHPLSDPDGQPAQPLADIPADPQPESEDPHHASDEAQEQPRQTTSQDRRSHVHEATVVRHADVVEVADYVRHSDKTSHRGRRWPGCLFGLFCLVLGYVIGCYLPVKMPTLVTRQQVVGVLQYVNSWIDAVSRSLETQQDTTQVQSPEQVETTAQGGAAARHEQPAPGTPPAEKTTGRTTSPGPSAPAATASAVGGTAPAVVVAKPQATTATGISTAASSATSPALPTASASYPQLPGGGYEIVGVEATEVMSAGKTLLKLSTKYYGSKHFVDYICVMNGITNPDIVPLNKELRIPKLRKK